MDRILIKSKIPADMEKEIALAEECKKYGSLVSPDEAIETAWHRTICDVIICRCIRDLFNLRCTQQHINPKEYEYYLFSAVWNAGRVHGIREERRRKRSDNKQSKLE